MERRRFSRTPYAVRCVPIPRGLTGSRHGSGQVVPGASRSRDGILRLSEPCWPNARKGEAGELMLEVLALGNLGGVARNAGKALRTVIT